MLKKHPLAAISVAYKRAVVRACAEWLREIEGRLAQPCGARWDQQLAGCDDLATVARLVLSLQPEEGVQLTLMTKEPGPGGFRMRSLPLNLNFPDAFSVTYPDAYERLLMEVLRGNPALFMRRDEIEAAWQWIDRIIDSWASRGVRTHEYMAGSWGPTDSFVLLDRDGRRWAQPA